MKDIFLSNNSDKILIFIENRKTVNLLSFHQV